MTLVARLLERFLRHYAEGQAAAVAPFVRGRRLLDLGAGEAFVATALRGRDDLMVCSVDVGLFRQAPVPYVVYDGLRLPFRDATFDTTLVLLTLHHCAAPETVLDEALRVTRQRLIVTESVYRNGVDHFWLHLLDGRLNRHRHGGRMPAAPAFGSPERWQALFAARGFATVETRWLGPWWERLVHHPLLYALERGSARPEALPTPSTPTSATIPPGA